MSREIKFRVWDKNRKVWGSPLLAMTSGNIHFDWRDRTIINDDIEVMQFTGLKDKNGKEIYEGDIVRIHNYSTGWKHGDPDGDWRKFKVFWNKYNYAYKNEWIYMPFSDYNLNTLEAYNIEVIGNIYENPELMKGL